MEKDCYIVFDFEVLSLSFLFPLSLSSLSLLLLPNFQLFLNALSSIVYFTQDHCQSLRCHNLVNWMVNNVQSSFTFQTKKCCCRCCLFCFWYHSKSWSFQTNTSIISCCVVVVVVIVVVIVQWNIVLVS